MRQHLFCVSLCVSASVLPIFASATDRAPEAIPTAPTALKNEDGLVDYSFPSDTINTSTINTSSRYTSDTSTTLDVNSGSFFVPAIAPVIAPEGKFVAPQLNQYLLMPLSAQSGVTSGQVGEASESYYIQGSYVVASYRALNISFSAKIEQLDEATAAYFYAPSQPLLNSHYWLGHTTTSTTLGIVGNYQLSTKWSIIGAVTTTSVANQESNHAIDNEAHMALIGTSYSF